MADVQITVVDLEGIEDQVSGGKAVIGNRQVIFHNVAPLCSCRVCPVVLQVNSKLAVNPVGKRAAVKISVLIPAFLAVRRAELCESKVYSGIAGLSRYQVRICLLYTSDAADEL